MKSMPIFHVSFKKPNMVILICICVVHVCRKIHVCTNVYRVPETAMFLETACLGNTSSS